MAIKNGRYEYPEDGWSTGTMRKVGDPPVEAEDEPRATRYAMDLTRRGTPDSGLLTEMDRAAGFGLTARGATTARAEVSKGAQSLSPDVIEQRKSAIQGMANQWQLGTVDWNKLRKEVKYKGFEILWAPADMIPTGGPVMSMRDFAIQEWKKAFQGKIDESISYRPVKAIMDKLGLTGILRRGKKEVKEEKSMGLRDPNGTVHEIELGEE